MRNLLLIACLSAASLAAQPVDSTLNRKAWVLDSTLGPESLAGGLFSSALGTWRGTPSEYDTHWTGYGQRYGMRMTGIATQNVMEASLGAIWGEDPRYHKAEGSFKHRVASAFKQTVLAQRSDGTYAPAYARYAAISGSNFLSNSWRADSEAKVSSALLRTGYGFLGRLAGNAFAEFSGDAWRALRRR